MTDLNGTKVADYTYSYTSNDDGVVFGPFTPRTTKYSFTDSVTTGENLKGWRKLIANGDNATTAMSGDKYEVVIAPGKVRCGIKYKPTPYPIGLREVNIEGNFMFLGSPSFTTSSSETSADNRALAKYYSNVASVATKFQGLTFTGELRESLNMIKKPAKGLRDGIDKYLDAVRRRARRRLTPRQLTQALAETWLEYAFGWKPLISDIDNAITAFYQSDAVHPIFEMVKGSGRDEAAASHTDVINLGFWQVAYDEMRKENIFVQYRGIYESRGDGVSNSHTYGFRPAEFVPTLWELIPYSFLVDYFTNIGEIVSSWSYRFIGTKWTSKLVRREWTFETINPRQYLTSPLDPVLYDTFFDGTPGYQFISRKSFVRTPSVEPGLPSLEFQVPGFGTKWVNMTALLAKHRGVLDLISQLTRK